MITEKDNVLSNKNIFISSLFKRPKSLTEYLPYEEFLDDQSIYVQKDGSLGVILKVKLVEHEPRTSSEIVRIVSSLKSLFTLPENCTLQVLFDQNYISPRDKIWQDMIDAYPLAHPVSNLLFKEKVDMLQNASGTQRAMKRDTLISIRFYPDYMKNKAGVKSVFSGDDFVLLQETQKFARALREFDSIIKVLEENSLLELERTSADELIDVLRRWFNPTTYYKREFAPFNTNCSISKQVLYNSPTLDYVGIEREGLKSRTLSLKMSPNFAYHGGMAYFLSLEFPFRISLNFSFPTKSKVKKFYDIKQFLLDKAQSPSAKRQLAEINETQEKLAYEDRCLFMTFNVIVEGENDDILDDRVRKISSVFNNELECEVIEESDIGLGLFLNSLPLSYIPKTDFSTQRYIRILRSDAIKFVPIFNSFTGLQNPLQIYLSRESNLAPISLLENQTSNHTVVVADTGSGKSAFVLDCAQALKRIDPEPLLFVIDKKSSYKVMGKFYDADMTIFGENEDMPFSPFRGYYDSSKITFLTNLIATAIKITSPNFDLESEHTSAISEALKRAYLTKVERTGLVYEDGELLKQDDEIEIELTMDEFIAELAALTAVEGFTSLESSIETMINKLRPFYGDGMYAKYFNTPSEGAKKKDCRFFIYDLDALDADPTLQVLMTMSVIEEIRQKIRLPENKGRGGFIIIEELGMLGRNNPQASAFVIDAAETFRKLGFWLIFLTPNPRNYFELEVGRAAWAASDNFVFLGLKPDSVEYLKENSNLINEANEQILNSLRTVRGKHADVFIINKDATKGGVIRYKQTPKDRWLAPTNAKEDQVAQETLSKFEGEKWKALEYLTTNYPNGVQ